MEVSEQPGGVCVFGSVENQARRSRKHLGYIYFDELTGADETYARTHPKH